MAYAMNTSFTCWETVQKKKFELALHSTCVTNRGKQTFLIAELGTGSLASSPTIPLNTCCYSLWMNACTQLICREHRGVLHKRSFIFIVDANGQSYQYDYSHRSIDNSIKQILISEIYFHYNNFYGIFISIYTVFQENIDNATTHLHVD